MSVHFPHLAVLWISLSLSLLKPFLQMLSPAKCESEDPTAQLDLLHSSPRSEPERLSLVLSLPNPAEAEMSTSRRSTRINSNSPKRLAEEKVLSRRELPESLDRVRERLVALRLRLVAMQCRLVRSYSSLTLMDVCFLLWIDAERFWRIVIRVSQKLQRLDFFKYLTN